MAAAGLVLLPLIWRGISCGQDFDFHLQNWLEVSRSWHQGGLYPRWAASANYGAGEPRFVFYPPLSRYLGAGLGLVLPWAWVPLVFTALALLGAGWSFRAMAREWADEQAAAIGACLYLANPYLMFVAYERGALAELLAAAWVPLLVLFGLREKRATVPLALTVAAIWLTDPPAAVMGCYLLAAMVVVAALREHAWRLAGRAACGVALGLGLAGFWLVPAVYEQRWVEIGRAIAPLMRVEDSFLFGYAPLTAGTSGDARFEVMYHNQVLQTVSWIVVGMLVAFVLAAVLSRGKGRRIWLPLVVAGGVVCALQFRWSDFVWRIAPELKFLQFPWRWMLVLGMVFAALISLAIGRAGQARRAPWLRAGILVLAGGMALLASSVFWQPCDEQDNVRAQIATFHSEGFAGTDEYTPKGADNGAIQQDLPELRVLKTADGEQSPEEDNPEWKPDPAEEIAAQVKMERWEVQRMEAVVVTASPGYAVLRLMDYPAWKVRRSGAAVTGRPKRSDGLMVIPVPAGTTRIDVQWGTTADQAAGMGISLGALAITLAVSWSERRKERKAFP